MAYRFVYVARHGEAIDEGELSEAGRRQADALGRRIAGISFAAIHHGPLPRATETAHLVAAHLPGVPVYATEEVGDYLPYAPDTAAFPPSIKRFIDSYTPDEQAAGADLARAATEQFMTVPATMDADETHPHRHAQLPGRVVRPACTRCTAGAVARPERGQRGADDHPLRSRSTAPAARIQRHRARSCVVPALPLRTFSVCGKRPVPDAMDPCIRHRWPLLVDQVTGSEKHGSLSICQSIQCMWARVCGP